MDPEQKAELKKEYEYLSDRELQEMLAVDKSEYEEGVYELVEEEAQRRSLNQASPEVLRELDPYRLEVVHLAKNITEAGLLRGILQAEGIDCFYSEFPLSGLGGGGFMSRQSFVAVPVMVRETDAQEARRILESKEQT